MNSPNRIKAALPLRPLRFAAKPLSPDDCIRRPAADTNRPHRHGRTTPSQQRSSRKDRIRLRSTSGTTPRHLSLRPVAGIDEHIRFLVIQNIASYLFPETGRVAIHVQPIVLQLERQSQRLAETVDTIRIRLARSAYNRPYLQRSPNSTAVFRRIISIYSASVTSSRRSNSISYC